MSGEAISCMPVQVLSCVVLGLFPMQIQAAGLQRREDLRAAQERADYFERGIAHIEYYGAQLAVLQYRDGSTLRLGLVEPHIQAPVQSVDCHAQPGDLVAIEDPEVGLGLMTYAELAAQGTQHPHEPYPEHARRVMRRISLHEAHGRIIPNHINWMTAPALCSALEGLEAEFVRQCRAMAEASIGALESTALVLSLALLEQGVRGPPTAVSNATARAVGRIVAGGLEREAAEAALAGMRNGGGHAIRHLVSEGLIPNAGDLASRVETFRRIALPILTRPLGRPFAWRIGDTQATVFLGRAMGRWVAVAVAVAVAESGPWAGRAIAGLVPDATQIGLMLGRAGLGGL